MITDWAQNAAIFDRICTQTAIMVVTSVMGSG